MAISDSIKSAYKVYVEDNYIVMRFNREVSDKDKNVMMATAMAKEVIEKTRVFKKKKKSIRILIDLSRLGTSGYAPRESREQYAKITKIPDLHQVAAIGGGAKIRVIVRFIVALTQKRDILRFFNSKKEAVEWFNK